MSVPPSRGSHQGHGRCKSRFSLQNSTQILIHVCVRIFIQAERARNGIVTVIASLALAHEEARAILLSSDTLTNALTSRMHHLTSLIWEDDPRTILSSELINTTSRALSRTLFVFHYLLFANHPQAPFDLKRKIRAAPPPAAIDHMFNVTFGRLSFAPDLKNVPEEAEKVLGRIINSSEC